MILCYLHFLLQIIYATSFKCCTRALNHPVYQYIWLDLKYYMRFQVLTAASMTMTVFWNMASYSLTEADQHFRGVYCLHHQVLLMEEVHTSGSSVYFYKTRRHISEGCHIHKTLCFSFDIYMLILLFNQNITTVTHDMLGASHYMTMHPGFFICKIKIQLAW
jgi:hypothetical protein